MKPLVSVIIPTYKRPTQLIKAIKSLQNQKLIGFEIIVADNAADPLIKRIVEKFNITAKVKVKYIAQPILGLHHAWHKGALASRADLLFITEDEATCTRNCLIAYVRAFGKYPKMVAAGGPIKPIWQERPPSWLTNLIGKRKSFPPFSLMEPYNKFTLSSNVFFFATNMAIRRRDLFRLGGFNPEIFGDVRLGDGETGLRRKIKQRGWLIGYIPQALVYHHISKARMSIVSLRLWMHNAGAIDMYSLFHENRVPKNVIEILGFIPSIVLINLKRWIGNIFFRSLKAPLGLKLGLQFERTRGQFDYIKRFLRDKSLQKLVARKNWLTYAKKT